VEGTLHWWESGDSSIAAARARSGGQLRVLKVKTTLAFPADVTHWPGRRAEVHAAGVISVSGLLLAQRSFGIQVQPSRPENVQDAVGSRRLRSWRSWRKSLLLSACSDAHHFSPSRRSSAQQSSTAAPIIIGTHPPYYQWPSPMAVALSSSHDVSKL